MLTWIVWSIALLFVVLIVVADYIYENREDLWCGTDSVNLSADGLTIERKRQLLREVYKGLEYQFDSGYSWEDMIDDISWDWTPAEKEWAKEHTGYKAFADEDIG